MKYAIQKTNGQWWTGTCWGVEQAKELYDADDVPVDVDGFEWDDNGDGIPNGHYYKINDDEPVAYLVGFDVKEES
jgi:hypothetical protein